MPATVAGVPLGKDPAGTQVASVPARFACRPCSCCCCRALRFPAPSRPIGRFRTRLSASVRFSAVFGVTIEVVPIVAGTPARRCPQACHFRPTTTLADCRLPPAMAIAPLLERLIGRRSRSR